MKRSDLESYNELRHNTSDSDDEAEESTVRQMTVIESFARVNDSTTRNTTKQTTAGPSTSENIFSNNSENLPGTSCSLYESARGTVSGMKTMGEMFPNRGESDHLRNRPNFDLNKSRQKFHQTLKEHHKISNIPKFRCEML